VENWEGSRDQVLVEGSRPTLYVGIRKGISTCSVNMECLQIYVKLTQWRVGRGVGIRCRWRVEVRAYRHKGNSM